MGAQRRTALLSTLLPFAVVAVAWLFLVTYGTWSLVSEEWLSATYDSLAQSLMRGEATVDPDAIQWEGIKVGDRVYTYHAPFPALLRIVPNLLFPDMYAKWARISCLLAALLGGLAVCLLLLRAARENPTLTTRGRSWLVALSVVGLGLGSPMVYLISTARIYHEPILWGLAFSLVGLWLALGAIRCRDRVGWRLVGLALCVAGGVLSRLTAGVPLAAVWLVVALRSLWRPPNQEHLQGGRRPVVPFVVGICVIAAAVSVYGWYNYARFGSVWEVFDYRGFYLDPATFGGEINLLRLPSGLLNYFGFFPSYFSSESPFIRMAPSAYLDPSVFLGLREEAISLPFASSWLVLGAILGALGAVRRRRWCDLLIGCCLASEAGVVLCFYFITQRYEGELLPTLVWWYALFVGLWSFEGRWGRLLLRMMPILVCLSAFASVASTLDFHLRLCGDTPFSYKRYLLHLLRPGPGLQPWKGHRLPLSDLEPISTTYAFARMGLDMSFDGKILDVQGRLLARGLGMHAVSTATYRVPDGAAAVEALIGMPATCRGSTGSVRFEVLDQDGRVVYDSGVIRGSDPERILRVPLKDVREVTLKLGDGGDGIDSDHGVWGEVAFLVP